GDRHVHLRLRRVSRLVVLHVSHDSNDRPEVLALAAQAKAFADRIAAGKVSGSERFVYDDGSWRIRSIARGQESPPLQAKPDDLAIGRRDVVDRGPGRIRRLRVTLTIDEQLGVLIDTAERHQRTCRGAGNA